MPGLRRREFITLLGGAAVWPSFVSAQTPRQRPVVGTIASGTPAQYQGLRLRESFLDGLRELGYVAGRDFDVVTRLGATTADLPNAAEQLVSLNPDIIMVPASANALAVKKATSTIPIVVAALGNPVALGLSEIDSRRPIGNLTGIMPYVPGLPAKQLELARDVVPEARKIGVVNDTSDVKARAQWDEINATAARLHIEIVGAEARIPEEVAPAFRKFEAEGVRVVIILQSNFLILERRQIAAVAVKARLPTSTSRPPRRLASPCRRRCSSAPTR
jgi:putative ABC transport system substrate-binding protein